MVGGILATSPRVFWVSGPPKPTYPVIIAGENFEGAEVSISLLPDGEYLPADVVQQSNNSIKLIHPSVDGIYDVKIDSATGSESCIIGAPDVYFMSGDRVDCASQGGYIRVFGRSIGGVSSIAKLYLDDGHCSNCYVLNAESFTLYDAKFTLPVDMLPGEYLATVNNGYGSVWSDPVKINIFAGGLCEESIYDVTDYGAVGDASSDCLQAINDAISAASANGCGVVYFPAGRYLVAGTIVIPSRITLRGDSMASVNVLWDYIDTPPDWMIECEDDVRIEGITFYCKKYKSFLSANKIRLRNVSIYGAALTNHPTIQDMQDFVAETSFKYTSLVKVQSGHGSEITDCVLRSSHELTLSVIDADNVVISRNKIVNGNLGWYSISGCNNVIFEGNDVSGFASTASGGGVNTLFTEKKSSSNIYYAHNRVHDIYGWDREAMTTDASGGLYYGGYLGGDQSSIIVDTQPSNDWIGGAVYILSGPGMGQHRFIQSIDGYTLHLDNPWGSMPGSPSVITVTQYIGNALFIGNEFSDVGMFQFYGVTLNCIVAENKVTRSGGLISSGRWYRHYQPSWYNQFIGNQIIEGNYYNCGPNAGNLSGRAIIGNTVHNPPPNESPLVHGLVIADNHGEGKVSVSSGGQYGITRDVVVHNNDMADGVEIDANSLGVMLDGVPL